MMLMVNDDDVFTELALRHTQLGGYEYKFHTCCQQTYFLLLVRVLYVVFLEPHILYSTYYLCSLFYYLYNTLTMSCSL